MLHGAPNKLLFFLVVQCIITVILPTSKYKVSHFNDNNHEVFVVHVAADEVLEIFKD